MAGNVGACAGADKRRLEAGAAVEIVTERENEDSEHRDDDLLDPVRQGQRSRHRAEADAADRGRHTPTPRSANAKAGPSSWMRGSTSSPPAEASISTSTAVATQWTRQSPER